jgi:hypothetical protein
MSADDALFDRVGAALAARGGWNYEPASTPGALPSWCLDPGGQVTLSVNVVDGMVTLYLPDEDRDIAVDGIDGLLAWLDANAT